MGEDTQASDEAGTQPVSFDITDAVKLNAPCQVSIFCTRTFFNELGTGGLLGPAMIYREK